MACQTDNRSERTSRVPTGSEDGLDVEVDFDEVLSGRVFLRLVEEEEVGGG